MQLCAHLPLLAGQFEPAAAQVYRVGTIAGPLWSEELGVKGIDDELSLSFVAHQVRVPEDAHVVRHVGQLDPQEIRELTDILCTGKQALDELQPFRVREGLEEPGTVFGLQAIAHLRMSGK